MMFGQHRWVFLNCHKLFQQVSSRVHVTTRFTSTSFYDYSKHAHIKVSQKMKRRRRKIYVQAQIIFKERMKIRLLGHI